jgi:hypothetical protein
MEDDPEGNPICIGGQHAIAYHPTIGRRNHGEAVQDNTRAVDTTAQTAFEIRRKRRLVPTALLVMEDDRVSIP